MGATHATPSFRGQYSSVASYSLVPALQPFRTKDNRYQMKIKIRSLPYLFIINISAVHYDYWFLLHIRVIGCSDYS